MKYLIFVLFFMPVLSFGFKLFDQEAQIESLIDGGYDVINERYSAQAESYLTSKFFNSRWGSGVEFDWDERFEKIDWGVGAYYEWQLPLDFSIKLKEKYTIVKQSKNTLDFNITVKHVFK